MKRILALLLAVSLPVAAAPRTEAIANMKAWCDCVMVGGVCSVTNRPAAPGTRVFTPRGSYTAATYNAFSADPMMCDRGVKACTKSWGSNDCVFFTARFRQEPMVCERPGEPRAK